MREQVGLSFFDKGSQAHAAHRCCITIDRLSAHGCFKGLGAFELARVFSHIDGDQLMADTMTGSSFFQSSDFSAMVRT